MTESQPDVRSSWAGTKPTIFTVKIHDHGQVYEFMMWADDVRYAIARVLIENHIYLATADGIEIQPAEE